MERQELIDCFQDTLEKSRTGALAEMTRRAAESSRVYGPGFGSEKMYMLSKCRIQVENCTSLAAARKNLDGGRVAVLNFANPHYPGGGVTRGAMAQEECLCRSSNLYACLSHSRVFAPFYQFHRTKTDHDFSDRLIYTRNVTVFKDDSPLPVQLPEEDWFHVDVITCAAPYLAKRAHVNQAVLLELLSRRIRNILEAAIDNEVRVLILGAFGCGAFRNPPELVARAFRLVLEETRYQGAFSRVIFAVLSSVGSDPYSICPNLASFQMEFLGQSQELEKRRYVGGAQDDPSLFDVRMPGGRVRYRGSESRAYHQWQRENPYYGKQFSVLGDSISTLEGFNPRGHQLYYTGDAGARAGVTGSMDTWWGKVITFFGGELLVNDAWSGCRVSRGNQAQEQFPSGCSDGRTGRLHVGGVRPDVILVYMGVNDWATGIALAPEGEMQLSSADTYFSMAYGLMLRKLRANYPDSEIWCLTLGRTFMQSDPNFCFPDAPGGVSIREVNRQIANAAMANGCRVVDIYGQGIWIDTVDGVHPTAIGMDSLAVSVIRQTADALGCDMLDCELRHAPREGICRLCGKRVEEHKPRQKMLRLQMGSGEILAASGWQVTLGRSRECDLVLENAYVARFQATFTCREGQWFLRDNQTRNGTYLNGVRLEQDREYPLHGGDVISFARKEDAVFLE